MRQLTIEGGSVLTPTYTRRRAESITRLPQPGPISLTATRRKVPSSPMENVDTMPSAALETNASEGMLLILVRLTRHLHCAGSADFLPASDQAEGQAAVPITTVHDRIDHERTKPLIT